MNERKGKGFIRLIYSSSGSAVDKTQESTSFELEEGWRQLDLFVSEKPDCVIITQPDSLGFERLVHIISAGHARRILDLREMPYITSDNETRESFLNILENNHVEYLNIFKLQHSICDSVANKETEKIDNCLDRVEASKFLKPMIEKGPTVIFSDSDPDADTTVKKLLGLLSRAAIPYSTIYAS